MDVLESSILEESVSSISKVVPNSGHGSDVLSSRTHVSDLSEVLNRVVLSSEREGSGIALTVNLNGMLFGMADL